MSEFGNKIAKADIDLVDETFDASQSGSYHLSIQTDAGRLSFCVFNTVINKYIVLRSYPFLNNDLRVLPEECGSIFEHDDLLGLRYKSSGHLWVSSRSTLVPAHLFDPDEADTCLTFNHGATIGEHTLYQYMKRANLYHVFSYPETLMDLLKKRQPDIRLYHHAEPFIGSVMTRMSSSEKNLAVYLYANQLDILVVENNKLLFYNSFRINASEDSVYYLAGVSNLFNINLLSTKLIYFGDLKHHPSPSAILEKYAGSIIESEPPNAVMYSYLITESLRKRFINLFSLYGCES